MEKAFEAKMDEEVVDDGWGRHKIDDEVLIFVYTKNLVIFPPFCSWFTLLDQIFRWNIRMSQWKIHKKSLRNVCRSFVHQITLWNPAFSLSSNGKSLHCFDGLL